MKFRLLSLIIATLLIQACSFKKDDSEASPIAPANTDVIETIQKEQEKQAFEGKLTEQNVSVKFEEMPEPMGYKMIIEWPEQAKRVQVSINGKIREIYNSNNSQNTHVESVKSGEVFEINLIAYDSLGMAPYSTITLNRPAPIDHVVGGIVRLTKDLNITIDGRFYFLKDSQILTMGHNLSINAKKLIVEDDTRTKTLLASHIITRFPSEPLRKPSEIQGSNVSIQATVGIGQLLISMVGASGKDGISGKDIEIATGVESARSGLDGIAGTATSVTKPCPRKLNLDAPPCDNEIQVCSKLPENGQPGKEGRPGADGLNGEDGGSTGTLSIFIDDQKEFSAHIFQRRGLPGKGGKGAPGHSGGVGGAPGANPSPCPPAKKGADGQRGTDGKNGLDGSPGLLGEIFHNIKNIYVEKQ
ncbi:MAG: hypothetical protein OM95_08635 [Bdellovibrio sp. ArHS]|uniref:collagen-like protein n=1 Tax=Bdellovibrio sp. ArHS TaxID=1569284 RepID=UPI000582FCFB|nr:collagen-like protein [Bdellovibrio sp. ArHS]KHD88561.1 MAG: hypothetical protein OM95_08635 [Bdellovibrio sp. ArHS]